MSKLYQDVSGQVVSPSQAIKLANLGVLQQSIFYRHVNQGNGPFYFHLHENSWIPIDDPMRGEIDVALVDYMCSAFTVGELFRMFPNYYLSWSFSSSFDGSERRSWIATVFKKLKKSKGSFIETVPEFDRYAETQAEALADLLISALTVGVFTVDDVNKRITK